MSEKNKKSDESDRKLYAFLATFLSIIGFVIALLTKKDDKYVMFYAKQSLVIFIVAVIASIIGMILVIIPVLGSIIYWVLQLLVLVLWIISWIYALSGTEKEVPIVGKFAEKIAVNARELVKEKFSWYKMGEYLDKIYEKTGTIRNNS